MPLLVRIPPDGGICVHQPAASAWRRPCAGPPPTGLSGWRKRAAAGDSSSLFFHPRTRLGSPAPFLDRHRRAQALPAIGDEKTTHRPEARLTPNGQGSQDVTLPMMQLRKAADHPTNDIAG